MTKTKHDIIAEKIAKKLRTEYNPAEGPDIKTKREVDEVEVDKNKLKEGMSQLKGYRHLKYIVVPKELVPEAKEATEGTKIGVKDERGIIRKPSRK